MSSLDEKDGVTMKENGAPFAALDGRNATTVAGHEVSSTVASLADADEALAFLEDHPQAAELAAEAAAILEDPARQRKLLRKIDFAICPLLACVYFLQFLDKTGEHAQSCWYSLIFMENSA